MGGKSSELRVRRAHCLGGEISVPGDKSISHRAVMFASLADGDCRIEGFLPSEDCLATVAAMRSLGVSIDVLEQSSLGPECLLVHGRGMVTEVPPGDIDCGNSGTTMRLMSGILAGQGFASRLVGDESLSKRPMGRVIRPLSDMGADIKAEGTGGGAPLAIRGSRLQGIRYELPVASAQVKSAVLLAGLFAEGLTTVIQPVETRDHTERMLNSFKVRTRTEGREISIAGGQKIQSCDFVVPGDISSASFWLVAASVFPGSQLKINNVGLNPTRSGVLEVLIGMGANITSSVVNDDGGEKVGDITVCGEGLNGIEISGGIVANIIDELPILAVAAALAEGTTMIRDAGELRVKETDRIAAVAKNLQAMGADIEEFDDGMRISGGKKLHGACIESYGDHRIAMAFAIAGLFADGDTVIENADCIAVSYPGFERDLEVLSSGVKKEQEEGGADSAG
ncbi:MAG: 3-phosphoshikimate 1-carboxyvinyltransferase [Verrucomicrobiaceae bacterium]|nr:3-phosphoshikimate 1-carboxyvinyltransferase [Verrucomicrobiaceae bacterium]